MSEISKYFRLNGVNIRSDAAHYLSTIVDKKREKAEKKFILEQVIRYIQRQPETPLAVSVGDVELAIKEFTQQDDMSGTDFFWVYDAFSIPRLIYDDEKKHFYHALAVNAPAPRLHEDAQWKCLAFVERYDMLFERCLRTGVFARSSYAHEERRRREEEQKKSASYSLQEDPGKDTFVLHVIEELLSSAVPINNTTVLGMLSSLQENKYHLEDPTGAIELDIGAHTSIHHGLFIENVFVLVEGWYADRVFHATGLGMPPPEARSKTQLQFGDFNFFGGPSQVSLKSSAKLKRLEKDMSDEMFVIISDLWLDRPDVLSKLDILFKGFDQSPPFCFIFCGDFISQTESVHHGRLLKDGLKALEVMLRKYNNILSSKMVFVPGPSDVGATGLLPRYGAYVEGRHRIPANLTAEFESKVKNAIFTSNPCRIQYCTKEIVVMREDILTKMCRTLIKDPICEPSRNRMNVLTQNLARTIASQGHLCPLPPHILPTYWSFDHVLRLYALPDLIVLADIQEPFVERKYFAGDMAVTQNSQSSNGSQRESWSGCIVANPSSFPRHNFQFHVYVPHRNIVDLSQID